MRILVYLLLFARVQSKKDPYISAPALGGMPKPNYHDDDDDPTQCTPIREPVCQGLKYTDTRMPNWVKMTSQEEAAKRMIDYQTLLNINCSHYLKLFLCTIYFPMCTPVLEKSALKPCKPLCVHVRDRCEPIMQSFKFNWPGELSCEDLPESPALCIEPDGYDLDTTKTVLPTFPLTVDDNSKGQNPNFQTLQRMYPQLDEIFRQQSQGAQNLNTLLQAAAIAASERAGGGVNRACSAAEFSTRHFSNGTCLSHCGADLNYKPADKKFARTWFLVWAVCCLISSALTFLTFFADGTRLQYPERPVLYLAACYFAIGFGHILQYSLGAEKVTCRSIRITDDARLEETRKYMLKFGQEGTWCTVGFLILYYFGMASNFWWVMLSLAWYLSTSRKWGREGVESVSSVFHMFAWALPAIQSILILILHKIDADELTGTCYTGNHSESTLLFGVLLPQAFCLITGLILLSIGFSAVFRVRQSLKTPNLSLDRERESRRRLEKSIAKLGVFALLYTFPMICLIAGNLYDYLGQPKWRAALDTLHQTKPHCLSPRGVAWGIQECHPIESPSSEAAMLRIFMSLVVGITSGMWVWANKKTISSWHRVFCRRCIRKEISSSFGKFDSTVGDGQMARAGKVPTVESSAYRNQLVMGNPHEIDNSLNSGFPSSFHASSACQVCPSGDQLSNISPGYGSSQSTANVNPGVTMYNVGVGNNFMHPPPINPMMRLQDHFHGSYQPMQPGNYQPQPQPINHLQAHMRRPNDCI